jgi:hypothetical protein
LLQDLEVPPAEITAAKTIYLRAIARDLAHIFFSVIRNLLRTKIKILMREREALFGKNPLDMRDPKGARWDELLAEQRRIETQVEWPDNVFGNEKVEDLKAFCMAFEDLKAFCMAFIERADVLTNEERSTLVAIADEVDSLFRACREAGNYTPESIRYLETYALSANYVDNQNLRFAQAFPETAKGAP